MSLDKAIEHGKEKRKQYTGAKAIYLNCRNHGSCDFCKSNRMYQQTKADEATRQKIVDYDEYANTPDAKKAWVEAVD